MASVAFKYIPETAATTFAFSSVGFFFYGFDDLFAASVDYSLFRSSNMSSLLSKIKTAETEGVPKGPETRNLFSDIFNFFGDILKTILPKPAAGDKKGANQSGADYKYLSDAALPTQAQRQQQINLTSNDLIIKKSFFKMFIFLKDSSSKCYLFERFLLQNVSFSKGPIFKMLPIQKVPSLKKKKFQTGFIFKMFPIQKVSFSNVQSSNCFLPKMFSIQSASHSKSSLVKVFLTHKIPSSKCFFF